MSLVFFTFNHISTGAQGGSPILLSSAKVEQLIGIVSKSRYGLDKLYLYSTFKQQGNSSALH